MTTLTPQRVDLLLTGGVIITVDPERRILTDGYVAVEREKIVAVGRRADLPSEIAPARTIDLAGGVVTPGFIDCHTHTSQHLGRGSISDRLSPERELEQHIPYVTHLNPDDIYRSAMLACLEMARNGTTTFSDMSGFGDSTINARAATSVGLRGIVTERVWDVPPFPEGYVGTTDDCVKILERVLEKLPYQGPGTMVWGGVGLPGMGTASDSLIKQAKALATSRGLILYMHQSFGTIDTQRFRERTGGRSASEHLDEIGVLDQGLQLIHMIRTELAEVQLLAAAGTHIVHCPAASTRVGMQVSSVGHFPEMVAARVNVALGSDSGNYSDFYDVGRQMYLAATIHREARGGMPTITAEQAVEMATIEGAKAIGAESWLGSIEVGKQADIVVHRWNRPEWRPGVNPINSLVYSAQSAGVDTVIVGGEMVLDQGVFTRVDEDHELHEIDRAARELNARSGYKVTHEWPYVQ